MYTTFIKSEGNKKIDYLSLIIHNKQFIEHSSPGSKIVTVDTKNVPKSISDICTNNKELISFLEKDMQTYIDVFKLSEKKNEYYREFKIPKRKGGFRYLIEPVEHLKTCQQRILGYLTDYLKIIPHNASHAFTKQRDAFTNAEVHKESDYIIKFDFADFFPSITKDILKKQLLNLSHFVEINKLYPKFLDNLIEIATYKDCLPQGSPLSPYLSNLVMVDFDYTIYDNMKKGLIPHYRYSRYADDLTFSASYPGKLKELMMSIQTILLEKYDNKIKLKEEKTQVLSVKGKCFITGIKVNKDHNLTFGHEKKSQLKHDICNMLIKFQNNTLTKEEAQSTLGLVSYMRRIEPEYTDYICNKYLKKFKSRETTLAKHLKSIL